MSDLVSIITPSYNCGAYIADTINSVLAQTYPNWEMIIVDDCSTDDTAAVVAEYERKDQRIRFIRNERNSGAAVSRNRALREARGRWVAFLDGDDLWEPFKLQHQIDFMTEHDCVFSYHKYDEIDENGKPRGAEVGGPRKVTKRGIYACNWLGCLTVMYDRTRIGLIQVANIYKRNDYAMWLQVTRKADCYLMPEVAAHYRRRSDSISHISHLSLLKWQYQLFSVADRNNPLVSVFFVVLNLIFTSLKKIIYVKRSSK